MKALIDEDLHKSFQFVLESVGFEAWDARDIGLRGKPDTQIFTFAQKHRAVLFSADLGFANILDFPLQKHYGIVILRFPNEMSTNQINKIVLSSLEKIDTKVYKGNLIIISPRGVRIRGYL